MAINTKKEYRNQVMYSVFVRNYSEEGTFEAVRKDLDRIKSLGVDIIWLMPIHPIGEKARKGTVGSPYAISDYRKVNPEFGTVETEICAYCIKLAPVFLRLNRKFTVFFYADFENLCYNISGGGEAAVLLQQRSYHEQHSVFLNTEGNVRLLK